MSIQNLESQNVILQDKVDAAQLKVKRLREQLTLEETELIGAKKALSDNKELLRLAKARIGITHK